MKFKTPGTEDLPEDKLLIFCHWWASLGEKYEFIGEPFFLQFNRDKTVLDICHGTEIAVNRRKDKIYFFLLESENRPPINQEFILPNEGKEGQIQEEMFSETR